jgi:hypothetical protein
MVTINEYEVDERDVEYQRQADKAWLTRIYQPKGTGPFPTIVGVNIEGSRLALGQCTIARLGPKILLAPLVLLIL